MTFASFIDTAWNDHGDRPQEVADRLANSKSEIETADDLARFAQLATHVYGEHLGRWQDGVALLESLHALPAFAGSVTNDNAVARGVATLRYANGDIDALQTLTSEERVAVLATAASALCTRSDTARAIAAYEQATQLAATGLPEGSPAFRALAVAGNNLAADLEEKRDRTPSETAGMVHAAQNALKFWKIAGTWLQEERAEYRLSRSLLQAAAYNDAVQCAQRCLDTCTRNAAPPLELFFASATLAVTQAAADDIASSNLSRTAALAHYQHVPRHQQSWCAQALEELKRLSPC